MSRPNKKEDELREELDSHLRMASEARIERGMPPYEAAVAARRELGNLSQIQEATRDVWGRRWLERAAQDVRYALRVFAGNRSFAALAIVSLALGIGANTALFQMVNAVRLQALPVADPSSLAEIRIVDMDGARGSFGTWHPAVTNPIWEAIRDRQQAFTGVFAWSGDSFNTAEGGEVRLVSALWVSGNIFDVLGVRPAIGRTLTVEDDRRGCAVRTVLSYAFWQRAYGGQPTIVGQTLMLNGRAAEIVGVAAEGFRGMEIGRSFDVALPVCADAAMSDDGQGRLAAGTEWWLSVFGRLKPGWTVQRASAHLAAISPELFLATMPPNYPAESVARYKQFTLGAFDGRSGLSQMRQSYGTPLLLLLATAGVVLLIACANLANLLLARATARQREIAIRLGLGASRGRVIRQLLTESLLLAVIGGACGLLLARWLSPVLLSFLNTSGAAGQRVTLSLGLDWRVAGFTAGLATITCLLFGAVPAFRATRVSPDAVLRGTGRSTTAGREVLGLRRSLVIAQIALSVVLLFGSLLFARTLRNLSSIDVGFLTKGLLTSTVSFRGIQVRPDQRSALRRAVIDRIRALPGVESAAVVRIVPVSGNSTNNDVWPEGDRVHRRDSRFNVVGRGYFATLGVPIVAGLDFEDSYPAGSVLRAIVNEAFVAEIIPDRPPIGARFTRQATPSRPEETYEIVGVVKNTTYSNLKEQFGPIAFLADAQANQGPFARVILRATLAPEVITGEITRAMSEMDPKMGVSYSVLSTDLRDALLSERLLAALSSGFGALAAILTLVGLYGVVAYTVARRTNEIGVRMALGAGARDIVRLVLRETGVMLAVGAGLGAVLAVIAGRAVSTLLFGVPPHDPILLLVAVGCLTCIAGVASYAPTRRATRIQPIAALRVD
jgi:putative ABC transport system permease protein